MQSIILIFILFGLFYQFINSFNRKHRNEWHRHPVCHYCNNQSNFLFVNEDYVNETIETNKFVVDIFILIKFSNEYKYMVDGTFWYLTKIIETFNDPFFYNRIHMITDSNEIYYKGISFGYNMYNLTEYKALELDFYQLYFHKHNSFNRVDYEFLCFYRWILYKHIIEKWNRNVTDLNQQIHRILSIDSDILFFMNPAKFYYKIMNSLYYDDNIYSFNHTSINFNSLNNVSLYDYELIVATKGAVQIFTTVGLINYARYVYNFYNRTISVVNSATNAAAVSYFNFKVFSDMQLIELFCKENKYKRNICYEEISTSTNNTRSMDQNCLIERLECIPLGNVNLVMKMKSYSLYYKDKNYYGINDKYPYCYMHFQGDAAKEYFEVYARYQSRILNLKYDNKPLLIQVLSQASIYYIDSHGYRRSFGDYYQFLKFNFTEDMITKKLPYFVVNGFPLGEQLKDSDDYQVAHNL